MNRFICAIFAVLLIFAGIQIIGCGGGGGDSSASMTPEELEVAAVVDSFVASVRAENIDDAKKFIDSNLYYYRIGNIIERGPEFETRLKNFFDAADIVDFSVDGMGVTVSSEDFAEVRGRLEAIYSFTGQPEATFSEDIRIKLERISGQWGLTEFCRDATDAGSAFPPLP